MKEHTKNVLNIKKECNSIKRMIRRAIELKSKQYPKSCKLLPTLSVINIK